MSACAGLSCSFRAFGNFDIIESRAPFVKSLGDGESEEGGVGRNKKMAVGTAYANNSRLARSRRGPPSDSMFSSLLFSLSLVFPVSPVCLPISDMPRPISVPPHLSLFANRKGASRSRLWSWRREACGKRHARGLGDARHGWCGWIVRGKEYCPMQKPNSVADGGIARHGQRSRLR